MYEEAMIASLAATTIMLLVILCLKFLFDQVLSNCSTSLFCAGIYKPLPVWLLGQLDYILGNSKWKVSA